MEIYKINIVIYLKLFSDNFFSISWIKSEFRFMLWFVLFKKFLAVSLALDKPSPITSTPERKTPRRPLLSSSLFFISFLSEILLFILSFVEILFLIFILLFVINIF